MGYNVLFVVPTNVLVQKYNDAATINEFFGFGINEEKLKNLMTVHIM